MFKFNWFDKLLSRLCSYAWTCFKIPPFIYWKIYVYRLRNLLEYTHIDVVVIVIFGWREDDFWSGELFNALRILRRRLYSPLVLISMLRYNVSFVLFGSFRIVAAGPWSASPELPSHKCEDLTVEDCEMLDIAIQWHRICYQVTMRPTRSFEVLSRGMGSWTFPAWGRSHHT